MNDEERAWGRRLSKRYGAVGFDDRTMVATAEGDYMVLDHKPSGSFKCGETFDPEGLAAREFVIAWGWAMAEFLEKCSNA